MWRVARAKRLRWRSKNNGVLCDASLELRMQGDVKNKDVILWDELLELGVQGDVVKMMSFYVTRR